MALLNLLKLKQTSQIDLLKAVYVSVYQAVYKKVPYINDVKFEKFIRKFSFFLERPIIFKQFVFGVLKYYQKNYPFVRPTLNHVLSKKFNKFTENLISYAGIIQRDFFVFPQFFIPVVDIDGVFSARFSLDIPEYKLEKLFCLAEKVYLYQNLIKTAVPSAVIGLEKLAWLFVLEPSEFFKKAFFVLKKEKENEVIDIVKTALLCLQSLTIDKKKRFKNKVWLGVHLSKVFISKQKLFFINKGVYFSDLVMAMFSPIFRVKLFGSCLHKDCKLILKNTVLAYYERYYDVIELAYNPYGNKLDSYMQALGFDKTLLRG